MLDPDLEKMHKDFLESSKYMSSKFQEATKKFDELKDLLGKLHAFVNDTSLQVSINQNEHQKFVEWSNNVRDASVNCHTILKDMVDANVSAIISLKNDINKFENLLRNVDKTVGNQHQRLNSLETKASTYLTPDHLAPLNRRMNEFEDCFEFKMKEFQDRVKNTELAHSNLKDQVTQVSSDLNQYANIANSANECAKSAHARCDKFEQNMRDSIASISRLTEDAMDKKIASIPKPQIPDYSAQIKSIEAQHEPIRFDAANAKLRSENTEKKMFLLEKKVEQLQLLLDKLKLGG